MNLTSTAYAILGLVALKPCTTYELSEAMRTNFDYFWPRARSGVYAEVKRLAARGLLDPTKDFVGKRPRTTYAITEVGRGELAAWLATPPTTFALELEGLVRILLAPFGTRDDLLRTLERLHVDAETMLGIAADYRARYLEGRSPFMDQVHLRALLNDFLANYAALVHDWSERSLVAVRAWDDLAPAGKTAAALETIASLPPHPPDP